MADILYKWRRFNPKTESYQTTEKYYEDEWQEVSKIKNVEETYYEYGETTTNKGFGTYEGAYAFYLSYQKAGYDVQGPYKEEATGDYFVIYKPKYKKTRTVPKVVWEYDWVSVPKTRTVTKQRTVKGTYKDEVTSYNRSEYPDNGQKGSYFFEYAGIANQPPIIRATNTQMGTVKADFDIRYTVSDGDGDKVKVQVMVDDRVIQYPMETPLDREQTVKIRLSDYALGDHTVTVTATDTNNASDSVTYYFTKSNQAPTISGSDLDLGGVFEDVSVDYIVQDADGDSVEVKISLDGAIKQPFTQTTLGVRRTFTLPIKSVELGRHRIEIEPRHS